MTPLATATNEVTALATNHAMGVASAIANEAIRPGGDLGHNLAMTAMNGALSIREIDKVGTCSMGENHTSDKGAKPSSSARFRWIRPIIGLFVIGFVLTVGFVWPAWMNTYDAKHRISLDCTVAAAEKYSGSTIHAPVSAHHSPTSRSIRPTVALSFSKE